MIVLVDNSNLRRLREWGDMNSSPVEYERPRKRVRISCADPSVHQYDLPAEPSVRFFCKDGEQRCRKTNRTWLTREELGYFRNCAKKLCRSQRLDGLLRDVYLRSCTTEPVTELPNVDSLAGNDAYVAQRGLERWSCSHHALIRSVKIVEVKTAVFLEQTSQFLAGKRNPATLAKVSRDASESSQQFARYLATVDAAIAKQVRDEK